MEHNLAPMDSTFVRRIHFGREQTYVWDDDLALAVVLVPAEKQILWLDVPVNHAGVVSLLKAARGLLDDGHE